MTGQTLFMGRVSKVTIVGRMYVRAPVNSNMMTTTVTVIRITPLVMPISQYQGTNICDEPTSKRRQHLRRRTSQELYTVHQGYKT